MQAQARRIQSLEFHPELPLLGLHAMRRAKGDECKVRVVSILSTVVLTPSIASKRTVFPTIAIGWSRLHSRMKMVIDRQQQ